MEHSKEDGYIFQEKLNKGSQAKPRLFFAFPCIIREHVQLGAFLLVMRFLVF